MYFIKWRGFTKPLWEPINLVGLTQATEDFHELYLKLL